MYRELPIRVACADDHTIVRKGIINIINSFKDFVVSIDASDGKALIEGIKKSAQLPHICLLDISMPNMNGYDTTEQIKSLWPEIKVLALTGFENDFSIVRMISSGANGYILKSSDINELENALRTVYERDYYHSELLSHKLFHIVKSKQPILPHLSEKEMLLLNHCCSDLTYCEIAKEMNTSARSVEGYRDSLFRKFNINSRTGLAMLALRLGVVRLV